MKLKEKFNNDDLINEWNNELDELNSIDFDNLQCNKILNSCMSKHRDTRIFNKKNINKINDILLNILFYLIVFLLIHYIFTLNINFYYKILKFFLLLSFIGIFFINELENVFSVMVLIILNLFKYIYPIFNTTYNEQKYSNIAIIRSILLDDKNELNKSKKIKLSLLIKYVFSNKFNIIRFPPYMLFKSITNIDNTSKIYNSSIINKNNNFIFIILHIFKVVFFVWEKPFQTFYDDKEKRFISIDEKIKLFNK